MEIRDFAESVLLSQSLDRKLQPPPRSISDDAPGLSVRHGRPGRPHGLRFARRRTAPAMPRGESLRSARQRAIAHHIMANHELQALEVMAWTLCVFTDGPPDLRRGIVEVMIEEQRHVRIHVERAGNLGIAFGSLPVNSYIWSKAMRFQNLLDYLAGIALFFEASNLDHTLEFAAEFAAAGDSRSAAAMETIHRDEIGHVRFGIEWLRQLKEAGCSDWEAYAAHLEWPLRPSKARGNVFQIEARRQAMLANDFIRRIETSGETAD